jgi:hypothetical protein
MDDDPAWRLLEPGTLVHVDADLTLTERVAFPDPPQHPLILADLGTAAATSQHAPSAASPRRSHPPTDP